MSKSRGTSSRKSKERSFVIVRPPRERGRRTTAIQTLILNKDKYGTLREARTEAARHGFKTVKVDEPARGTTYRFRQETPKHFERFITRELFPGAVAIIGFYKPQHYKRTSASSRGSR